MNTFVESSIEFRKRYKSEAIELIIASITNFFIINPIIEKLQFVINLGNNVCTYRDNPWITNYNLISVNNSSLEIENYKQIIGDLNIIFREAGIGLISLYGEGLITLCRKDFIN